jgi:hypothetical protein
LIAEGCTNKAISAKPYRQYDGNAQGDSGAQV